MAGVLTMREALGRAIIAREAADGLLALSSRAPRLPQVASRPPLDDVLRSSHSLGGAACYGQAGGGLWTSEDGLKALGPKNGHFEEEVALSLAWAWTQNQLP